MFRYIALLFLVANVAQAAADVLLQAENVMGTVYYDLTNELCGDNDPFVTDWAESSGINNGVPKCEQWAGTNAQSLAQIGTNRIVALDANMVSGNLDLYCGKQVTVFDENGDEFEFSEGPFVIWDACVACIGNGRIDMSAKAFTEIKNGTCSGNNPTGLSFQINNQNIWQPIPQDGIGGGPGSSSGSGSSGSPSSTSIATPTLTSTPTSTSSTTSEVPATSTSSSANGAASPSQKPSKSGPSRLPSTSTTSPASPSAIEAIDSDPQISSSSDAGCTSGAWQCSGNEIQICGYMTTTALGWETVGNCPNKCAISSSGSVDCE